MPTTLPASAVYIQKVRKQKGRGSNFLSLIPLYRPSHCPFIRISNSNSPRQVYYEWFHNTLLHERPVALSSDKVSSCEVDTAEDNVVKTSFRGRALRMAFWPLFLKNSPLYPFRAVGVMPQKYNKKAKQPNVSQEFCVEN